jgi:glycosyltransferase involved in cell wall biosynthesis
MTSRIRTFLVCPGLGHVARGYETFTRECFTALAGDERLDLHLYKGAGDPADRERAVWCLHRNHGVAAEWLGRLFERDGYFAEQATFAVSLIPHLMRWRPDVVYFSDGVVGNMLWRFRNLTGGRFKLLLSNGGPLGPPIFKRYDHIHQVSEVYLEESRRAGRPEESQTLLPYGFQIDARYTPLTEDERTALRCRLGLPVDRPVLLSAGAVNRSHKRMDYVIREVAALATPRPYLLLLGNHDSESEPIIRMGIDMLGPDGFRAATVDHSEIRAYYQLADMFVLASFREGMPRVLVEALAHGLPCITHDFHVTRFVLGRHGLFGDLAIEGNLTRLLEQHHTGAGTDSERQARHRSVYERFSWSALKERYVEMILRCSAGPIFRPDSTAVLVPALGTTAQGSFH